METRCATNITQNSRHSPRHLSCHFSEPSAPPPSPRRHSPPATVPMRMLGGRVSCGFVKICLINTCSRNVCVCVCRRTIGQADRLPDRGADRRTGGVAERRAAGRADARRAGRPASAQAARCNHVGRWGAAPSGRDDAVVRAWRGSAEVGVQTHSHGVVLGRWAGGRAAARDASGPIGGVGFGVGVGLGSGRVVLWMGLGLLPGRFGVAALVWRVHLGSCCFWDPRIG